LLFQPSAYGPGWLLLRFPFNWIFVGLQLFFYALAWFGRGRKLKGWMGKIIYIPSFLFNSNTAALQGLLRYLTSRQTVVWKKAAR